MVNLQLQMFPEQYNQPVILNTQPIPSLQIARYAKKFNQLGILQMVLGVMSFIFGMILIILAAATDGYYWAFIEYVAPGTWCGVFFVVSGILGCESAKKKDTCMVTGGLVMSIFSILAAATLLSLEIIGVSESARFPIAESLTYITAFHSILFILASVEFVMAITHSAYCCAALSCCCAGNPNQQQIVMTTGYTNPMMHNRPTALPVQVNTVGYEDNYKKLKY